MLKKILNLLLKFVRGESVLIVKQNKEKWDSQFRQGKWDFLLNNLNNQGHAAIIGLFCRHQSKKEKIKVLEVGCGNGLILGMVKAMCGDKGEYYGLDISQEAIDSLNRENQGFKLFCADAHEPPLFQNKFEVIIFSEVLYYIDFNSILKYKKLLNPGGVLIISLYDTVRTKIIWYKIKKYLLFTCEYKVYNKNKKVTWNIRMAKFI